jgi:hypothetical protein
MKILKTPFIMLALLACWAVNGFADSLYTWTDANGVIHVTQNPPPAAAKDVNTIDYSPQPIQPIRQSTTGVRPNQQQGSPNQGGVQARNGASAAPASGEAGDNIEYEYTGGPYRQTLRQYERRGELLDNNEPGNGRDRPVRVQPLDRGR